MNTEITERQQEIINVSLELIAESGIQSLTIKNLARKIGFAESAIYRHYENKIQILLAILNFFKQNSEDLFARQLNSSDHTSKKIETLFMNHFKKFLNNPAMVSVIFSEEIFRNEKELTEKVKEIMNRNIKTLETIIKTGQMKEEIRKDIDATNLSIIIMGALRMFLKQWHMSDHKIDLLQNGSEFIDSINLLIRNQS